jgi:hypothetical protein
LCRANSFGHHQIGEVRASLSQQQPAGWFVFLYFHSTAPFFCCFDLILHVNLGTAEAKAELQHRKLRGSPLVHTDI